MKAVLLENERLERASIMIIHPYSTFRMAWDVLTLILLLINMISIPIFMAFPVFDFETEFGVKEEQERCQWIALWIKIISDAFFATDMVLRKMSDKV